MLVDCFLLTLSLWLNAGNFDHFPNQNSHPRRGWTSRSVSRKPWSSSPSAPPTTLTSTLRMSISLLRPVMSHIAISCLSFGFILFHASHPFFCVIGSSRGPHYLHCSMGTSWPPGLSSFYHNSIQDGSAAFLYSVYGHLYLSCPTCPIDGPIKLNLTSLAFPKRTPSLNDCHPKNRIASPGTRTTALVICSSRPS